MKVSATEQGADFIEEQSEQLDRGLDDILDACADMKSIADPDAMGDNHYNTLVDALTTIENAINNATDPGKELVKKLVLIANRYREIARENVTPEENSMGGKSR